VEEVKPKLMRIRERIDTPGGTREGPLFLAELEVEDPQSGKRRSAEVEVLMLEGEPPVMGIRALEGLGIEVNFKERTYRLV
jgi:predicted aspartyl protease